MTDNEIIKALECSSLNDIGGCRKIDALDLINRQKAIIEKSEKVEHFADKTIETANAEIERLEKELMKCKLEKEMLYQTVEEIKSEAIKEFAEELEYFVLNEDIEVVEPKCKDYESYINGANQFRHQIKNGINNLVKEMTEVETNQRKEDEGK